MHRARWLILAELGLVALLGFIPLRWFRGTLLASMDTLLPQSWDHTMELLHVWNHRIGTGTIHTFDAAAWVFNVVPAAVLRWGGSMQLAQQIEFCVWYGLSGISMYLMMRLLYHGPHPVVARLAATGFYVCNFYIAPIWTGFNKPNIALYAFLPLLIVGLLKVLWGTWRVLPALGGVALLSAGIAAVGTNTPIVGIAVIAWGVVTAAALVEAARRRALHDVGRRIFISMIFVIVVLGIHAFWVLPQWMVTLPELPQSSLPEAHAQALAWNEGISRHASVFNVIRLQGDWTWYTGHGEPYVTYAERYLQHPFWIVLSWCVVAVVITGMLAPRLPFRRVFLLVTAIGLFGGMGTHLPTGWLFRWAIYHLPGFWMFRSAWFKFMLLTCVGYGFFVGAGAAWLTQRFRAVSPRWVAAGVIGGILLYASPVLMGAMFPTAAERRSLPPLHFSVPAYVDEAAAWFQQQSPDARVFVVPGLALGFFANHWGYGGSMPFLWYRIPQPLVYVLDPSWQMISQGAPRADAALVRFARQSVDVFQGQLTPQLDRALRLLGVRYLLHEGDFRYELLPQADTPDAMRTRLGEQRGLAPLRSFGPWDLYEVRDPLPHFFWVPGVVAAWGDSQMMPEFTQASVFDRAVLWWVDRASMSLAASLIQQGIVKEWLVAEPGADAEMPELPREMPVTVVVPSRRLTTLDILRATDPLDLVAHGVTWQWGGGMRPEAEGGWRWVAEGTEPTVIITNPYPWPVSAVMRFEITAFGRPRLLYPFVNEKLVFLDAIGVQTTCPVGTEPQTVIVPVVPLPPGQSLVRFYTTEPRVQDRGVTYSFGVRNFQVGDPVIRTSVMIPRAGVYTARLLPQYHGALTGRDREAFPVRAVQLHGTAVSLRPVQDVMGLWRWEAGGVQLPRGPAALEASPWLGEGWVLELSSGVREPASPPWRPITPNSSTPTSYTLEWPLTASGVLVFNESYHPGWTASPDHHLRINHLVNGWVVPAGTTGLTIAFVPQRWARIGQVVSVVIVAGLLVMVGLGVVWSWRRRQRDAHAR